MSGPRAWLTSALLWRVTPFQCVQRLGESAFAQAITPASRHEGLGTETSAGAREDHPCRALVQQRSLRSKRLRRIDARGAAHWRQRGHGRRDDDDRSAHHKRTGTEVGQDRD